MKTFTVMLSWMEHGCSKNRQYKFKSKTVKVQAEDILSARESAISPFVLAGKIQPSVNCIWPDWSK